VFYAFDLLHLNGVDLQPAPLLKRKAVHDWVKVKCIQPGVVKVLVGLGLSPRLSERIAHARSYSGCARLKARCPVLRGRASSRCSLT
jgi:hypothetical protein